MKRPRWWWLWPWGWVVLLEAEHAAREAECRRLNVEMQRLQQRLGLRARGFGPGRASTTDHEERA